MYDLYDFDSSAILQNIFTMFADWVASFIVGAVIGIIVVVALACLTYFILRHILYTLGQKAGLDNGWMAFVPVARAIYFCKLARIHVAFFLLNSKLMSIIICFLLNLIFSRISGTFALILVTLYQLAFWVVTLIGHMKIFARFGYNPYSAFLLAIPGLSIGGTAVEAVMAYSNVEDKIAHDIVKPIDEKSLKDKIMSDVKQILQANSVNSSSSSGRAVQGGTVSLSPDKYTGRIIGVSGKYVGVVFDIKNGEQFKFGRSADKSNIVFDSTDADISREHCIIRYANGAYQVTDVSTNGTYLEDGTAIGKGNTVNLSPGRVILLGKQKKNSFRLG